MATGIRLIMNIYFWLYFAGPLTLNILLFTELSSFCFDASLLE